MKILVIEDEKLLADSIGEVLRRKGFEVVHRGGGLRRRDR